MTITEYKRKSPSGEEIDDFRLFVRFPIKFLKGTDFLNKYLEEQLNPQPEFDSIFIFWKQMDEETYLLRFYYGNNEEFKKTRKRPDLYYELKKNKENEIYKLLIEKFSLEPIIINEPTEMLNVDIKNGLKILIDNVYKSKNLFDNFANQILPKIKENMDKNEVKDVKKSLLQLFKKIGFTKEELDVIELLKTRME
jgi:hypothetical protein